MFARLFSRWIFILALVLALPAARPALAQTAPTPHPAFEVTVTGHGRPVILLPGLTCPGAV